MAAVASTIGIDAVANQSRRMGAPLTGQVLDGKFRVREAIGRGGCSTVYAGWHLHLECPVAIKVMTRSVAPNDSLQRYFRSEAMVTARLVSPHLVHVYDRGVLADGIPYTVMECLQGKPLAVLLDQVGRLPVTLAVELALQVCSALVEAHAQSIAHCDIKPENLFLTELSDGSTLLKVIDFGTARGHHTPQYVWTSCVGTPGYMAPEQIRDPVHVDHRADIWAVGVVSFQMLSGRLPFGGSTVSRQMVATLTEAPAPLSTLVPELSAELCEVVTRCLAKDPAHRFQSVAQLAATLQSTRRCALDPQVPQPAANSGALASISEIGRSGVFSIRRPKVMPTDPPHRRSSSLSDRRIVTLCAVLACLGAALGTRFPARSWQTRVENTTVSFLRALGDDTLTTESAAYVDR